MESYEINDMVRAADLYRQNGDIAYNKGYYSSAKDSYMHAQNIANEIVKVTGLDYCNKDYLEKKINDCDNKFAECVY